VDGHLLHTKMGTQESPGCLASFRGGYTPIILSAGFTISLCLTCSARVWRLTFMPVMLDSVQVGLYRSSPVPGHVNSIN
jgi:hypothetical protein